MSTILDMACDRIAELLEENGNLGDKVKMSEESFDRLLVDYRKLNAMYIDTSEVNRNLNAENKHLVECEAELKHTARQMVADSCNLSLYRRLVVLFTGTVK